MTTAVKERKPKAPRVARRWISTAEAGRILDMNSRYVRKLALAGKLPYRALPDRRGVQVELGAVEQLARESVRQTVAG